ncbi:MAG: DsbA family protein [Spirochaetaceae bacterium]|jgi:predicted DsbA family dithiol-disulfide isomerase|nr:DsbA family protein [Spirochaetaceae bacterium]
MARFQLFYDYECPFCKRGYETLLELLPAYPGVEIEWIPVESHPRPEHHPPHTDLCVQSYYIARELNADMPAFHAALFQAVAAERRNVEDADVLTAIVSGVVDAAAFRRILASGTYAAQVNANNDLAYEEQGVWFVPAFRAGDKKLDAKGGAGVSREEVKAFLESVVSTARP